VPPPKQRGKPKPADDGQRVIKTKTFREEKVKKVKTAQGSYVTRVTSTRVIRVERIGPSGQGHRSAPNAAESSSQAVGSSLSRLDFPRHWKLSVRGVHRADGRSADEINGDYILDLVDADACAARWEHLFAARHGLFRAALDVTMTGNQFTLRASLAGLDPGPSWRAVVTTMAGTACLRLVDRGVAGAAMSWPGQVEVLPIAVQSMGAAMPSDEAVLGGSWNVGLECLAGSGDDIQLAQEGVGSF
jgi:hypothetical protein